MDPTEDGDYKLCFDNSFSKLSEKMVFFEVIINSQSSAGQDEWADIAMPESMVDYKLEDIRVRGDTQRYITSAAAMIPLQTTLELSDVILSDVYTSLH